MNLYQKAENFTRQYKFLLYLFLNIYFRDLPQLGL